MKRMVHFARQPLGGRKSPGRKRSTVAYLTLVLIALSTLLGPIAQPALTAPKAANSRASASTPSGRISDLKASNQRWIEIDLSSQRLIAWEGGRSVYAVIVSTGKRSTPTRVGTFAVQTKHRVARMRGAGYDIGDVPYTMYYSGNYAIHGAYWHHRFGTPVSHGCVNVAVNHAQWLFNWASVGTPVVVHQ